MIIVFILYLEMANAKKDKYGKLQCQQLIIS